MLLAFVFKFNSSLDNRTSEEECWSRRNVKFMNEGFYNMRCLVMLITAVCLLILLKYCLFSNMIKIFKTWYMSEIWMPRELPYSWARWIIRDLFQTNFPPKKRTTKYGHLSFKSVFKVSSVWKLVPGLNCPKKKTNRCLPSTALVLLYISWEGCVRDWVKKLPP